MNQKEFDFFKRHDQDFCRLITATVALGIVCAGVIAAVPHLAAEANETKHEHKQVKAVKTEVPPLTEQLRQYFQLPPPSQPNG